VLEFSEFSSTCSVSPYSSHPPESIPSWLISLPPPLSIDAQRQFLLPPVSFGYDVCPFSFFLTSSWQMSSEASSFRVSLRDWRIYVRPLSLLHLPFTDLSERKLHPFLHLFPPPNRSDIKRAYVVADFFSISVPLLTRSTHPPLNLFPGAIVLPKFPDLPFLF